MSKKALLVSFLTVLGAFLYIFPPLLHAQSCPYKKYGDADCDNVLTSTDYVIWTDEYLKNTLQKADFNTDTKVSLIDLEIYIRSLIQGLPPLTAIPSGGPSSNPTTVPTTSVTGGVTTVPSGIPTTVPTTIPTVAATNTPIPSGATYPAQVLNLTNWKVTVPTGNSESPTEVKQPALNTYALDPWFIVNPGGGVRFRAPVTAVTTGGSNYPRSELREMKNNGQDQADWGSNDGQTHTMIVDQAITAVPIVKKHIVAGQIHDDQDDVIVIRLEDKKLFVDINGADGAVLNSNYVLGTRFTVKFEVKNGITSIYYNNSSTPAQTIDTDYSKAYFKAGAYTQSNCNSDKEGSANCTTSNYGEVIIYGLSVSHQ